jgi:5-methylcytosine-specific restriction endonuclease McrA
VIDAATRQLVRQRARNRCEYCRLPQAAAPFFTFHIEHIRAKQHGGSDDLSNLALACPDCNAHKGPNLTAVDPDTDLVVPLFNPRTDRWDDHFQWLGAQLFGSTSIGRATGRLLEMNDVERVAMREELRGEL